MELINDGSNDVIQQSQTCYLYEKYKATAQFQDLSKNLSQYNPT